MKRRLKQFIIGIFLRHFDGVLSMSLVLLCATLLVQTGCKTPEEYRIEADQVADDIIQEKMRITGRAEEFNIERPSDTLRRRLVIKQQLPYAGHASLGTDNLESPEHWPEDDYPESKPSLDPVVLLEDTNEPVKITLMQALQIGASSSFDYQNRKEIIFQEALDLDLERNEFRTIFAAQADVLIETDLGSGGTVTGIEYGGVVGASKLFPSGAQVSADLAVSLANLLTLNNASALGISADATVSVPLMRGSGRHIVTEPLTQAERDVVYAIYDFIRFRQNFAVSIASEYLSVLRQLDVIKNNEENYRGLIRSARRARRLADAGRLTEVGVDQAVQDELRARDRWINAVETYKRRLDSFKNLLDLPPDAKIELDRSELERLAIYSEEFSLPGNNDQYTQVDTNAPSADAPVVLNPPDMENAGPLEINEDKALELAFANRVDLTVAQGEVYDAQRAIVVLADALRAELTLFGTAGLGGSRSISSVNSADTSLRLDKGEYSAFMTMDLPFERTAERNAYRNGYILLERAVRNVQNLEDEIKISIRNKLRDLLESRESLRIQARSVTLAQKRVRSTNLFLEAGRAEIRDLLEAQEALLSAQNSLTAAIINYRIAELELQRDMGVLEINEKGLWREYTPQEG